MSYWYHLLRNQRIQMIALPIYTYVQVLVGSLAKVNKQFLHYYHKMNFDPVVNKILSPKSILKI